MHQTITGMLLWSPRVLGLLTALFLGLFALDAFEKNQGFAESTPAFLAHLIPSFLLLLIVAVSWRRPWLGGMVFMALGLFYTFTTLDRPDWILTIAGPLYVVSVLYFLGWYLAGPPANGE